MGPTDTISYSKQEMQRITNVTIGYVFAYLGPDGLAGNHELLQLLLVHHCSA